MSSTLEKIATIEGGQDTQVTDYAGHKVQEFYEKKAQARLDDINSVMGPTQFWLKSLIKAAEDAQAALMKVSEIVKQDHDSVYSKAIRTARDEAKIELPDEALHRIEEYEKALSDTAFRPIYSLSGVAMNKPIKQAEPESLPKDAALDFIHAWYKQKEKTGDAEDHPKSIAWIQRALAASGSKTMNLHLASAHLETNAFRRAIESHGYQLSTVQRLKADASGMKTVGFGRKRYILTKVSV